MEARMKISVIACALLMSLASAPSSAQDHNLARVTKVTVQNGVIYVKGSSWAGAGCEDLYGTHGTLYSLATDPGYKNFYALALSAQLSGKGLWCYIGTIDSNKVCKMENCAIVP
jgi:hypothetical protein